MNTATSTHTDRDGYPLSQSSIDADHRAALITQASRANIAQARAGEPAAEVIGCSCGWRPSIAGGHVTGVPHELIIG